MRVITSDSEHQSSTHEFLIFLVSSVSSFLSFLYFQCLLFRPRLVHVLTCGFVSKLYYFCSEIGFKFPFVPLDVWLDLVHCFQKALPSFLQWLHYNSHNSYTVQACHSFLYYGSIFFFMSCTNTLSRVIVALE